MPALAAYTDSASSQIHRAFSTTTVIRMAPVSAPKWEHYDIVFIGGGSGGVAGSVRNSLARNVALTNTPDSDTSAELRPMARRSL